MRLSTGSIAALAGLALAAGSAHAGPPFTENWNAATSPIFNFLPNGGSTITSNVSDGAAGDGRVVQLTLPAFPGAGPGGGPNLQSNQLFGFGTYEARLKTADCSAQPSTGIISGFFTYLNDGSDQNGNGIRDNSEIDFEWLCAEPNVIWVTQWTDYQESPTLAMRRIMREIDLATGTIRQTCYSEGFGACTQNLTGSATEGQPSSITPIPGYNSATAYYTYGFTWLSNRLTWYVYHPTTGAKIILWDYQGPTVRITQRQAWYMFNVWHTPSWAPPGNPGAIQPPNTARNIRIDWATYAAPGATPTTPPRATATSTARPTPTATARPRATATSTATPGTGTNLALGRPAAASSVETSAFPASLAVDGNGGTRWASFYSDPQWISVDLGATTSISRVRLVWEAAYASAYQIQVSNDNATWSTIRTVTGGDGGVDDWTGLAGSGRWVRVYGTTRATAWGYSLWELEVYGAGGATPTATALPRATATATSTATTAPRASATATTAPRATATSTATATARPRATPTTGGATNVALGRAITSSTTVQNPAYVTNGDKTSANYAGVIEGVQWIQIDLGQSYSVSQVNLWHYFADGRTYRDVIVKLSTTADFSSGVVTVFNNDTNNSAGQGTGTHAEYAETAAGRTITFSPVTARYVRLWTNGSSVNVYNHYVEVEVWAGGGAPTPTSAPRSTPTAAPRSTPTTPPSGGKIVAGYYPNWFPSPVRIRDIHPRYTLVYLFHAQPVGGPPGTTGAVYFNPPGNGRGAATNWNADIQYARTVQGRRIILTVGGAGNGMSFPTRTKSQTFVDSIVALYNQWGGFDGLDWNTFEADQAPDLVEMQWISQTLKQRWPGFSISAPPAPWSQRDKDFCRAMVQAGAMDYAAPQYYDGPGLDVPSYVVGSVNEWVTLLGGANRVVVGFGIDSAVNYMTIAEAVDTMNQVRAQHPTIRGAFDWQIHNDEAQGWVFANQVGAVLNP
jgi:hypothetical protein